MDLPCCYGVVATHGRLVRERFVPSPFAPIVRGLNLGTATRSEKAGCSHALANGLILAWMDRARSKIGAQNFRIANPSSTLCARGALNGFSVAVPRASMASSSDAGVRVIKRVLQLPRDRACRSRRLSREQSAKYGAQSWAGRFRASIPERYGSRVRVCHRQMQDQIACNGPALGRAPSGKRSGQGTLFCCQHTVTFRRPIASKYFAGQLRARMVGADPEIEIDIPDSEAGLAVNQRLHVDSGAVAAPGHWGIIPTHSTDPGEGETMRGWNRERSNKRGRGSGARSLRSVCGGLWWGSLC